MGCQFGDGSKQYYDQAKRVIVEERLVNKYATFLFRVNTLTEISDTKQTTDVNALGKEDRNELIAFACALTTNSRANGNNGMVFDFFV